MDFTLKLIILCLCVRAFLPRNPFLLGSTLYRKVFLSRQMFHSFLKQRQVFMARNLEFLKPNFLLNRKFKLILIQNFNYYKFIRTQW